MTADPRIFLASRRLSMFRHIVPVLSPKGGVGKTTIATGLSIVLANKFGTVSLLDLDVNNPTAHIVLGVDVNRLEIEEDKGVLPLKLFNSKLEFMSIAMFTEDKLVPLRGKDISNAILELLSITRWNSRILIIDTPPGFSDEIMDLIRIANNIKPIIISTTDKLSLHSTRRLLEILEKERMSTLGIVVNMCRSSKDLDILDSYLNSRRIDVIACIPKVVNLDELYGRIDLLYKLFVQYLMKVTNILATG